MKILTIQHRVIGDVNLVSNKNSSFLIIVIKLCEDDLVVGADTHQVDRLPGKERRDPPKQPAPRTLESPRFYPPYLPPAIRNEVLVAPICDTCRLCVQFPIRKKTNRFLRVSGFGVWVGVSEFKLRISGFGFRVPGCEFQVSGFGYRRLRVSVFGVRVKNPGPRSISP